MPGRVTSKTPPPRDGVRAPCSCAAYSHLSRAYVKPKGKNKVCHALRRLQGARCINSYSVVRQRINMVWSNRSSRLLLPSLPSISNRQRRCPPPLPAHRTSRTSPRGGKDPWKRFRFVSTATHRRERERELFHAWQAASPLLSSRGVNVPCRSPAHQLCSRRQANAPNTPQGYTPTQHGPSPTNSAKKPARFFERTGVVWQVLLGNQGSWKRERGSHPQQTHFCLLPQATARLRRHADHRNRSHPSVPGRWSAFTTSWS